MPLRTDRMPFDIVESADINTIASAINSLEDVVSGKQNVGSYVDQLALDSAIGTRAAIEHNHPANAINTGTLSYLRLPNANTAARGAVELATNAEALAGTDTGRGITPATLNYVSKQSFVRKDNRAASWTQIIYGSDGGQVQLGNSTVKNWYLLIGDVCFFGISIVIGSSWNSIGIGSWMPNLPVMPSQLFSDQAVDCHMVSATVIGGNGEGVGDATIQNNGLARITRSYVKHGSDGTTIRLGGGSATDSLNAGNRVTWSGQYLTNLGD